MGEGQHLGCHTTIHRDGAALYAGLHQQVRLRDLWIRIVRGRDIGCVVRDLSFNGSANRNGEDPANSEMDWREIPPLLSTSHPNAHRRVCPGQRTRMGVGSASGRTEARSRSTRQCRRPIRRDYRSMVLVLGICRAQQRAVGELASTNCGNQPF